MCRVISNNIPELQAKFPLYFSLKLLFLSVASLTSELKY